MSHSRTIWAIGRNYRNHAAEMKADVPSEPLIFIKSYGCLEVDQNQITLPAWSKSVHHEIELLIELNDQLAPGRIAVALDLTERDEQAKAKSKGLPWSLAKSFKGSCPISRWVELPSFAQDKSWQGFSQFELELVVNGEVRQKGSTCDMIFSVSQILDFLQERFPIQRGDLLLTGTPAGVGPLNARDQVEATLNFGGGPGGGDHIGTGTGTGTVDVIKSESLSIKKTWSTAKT